MKFIAWWGAGLSTLLAVVKLWEIWRDRFQIDLGCNLTGDPEIGNEIFIRNLTGRPAILCYWELLYCSGSWPCRKYSGISSPGPDAYDLRVDAHSSTTLGFSETDYFEWSEKALNGRKIYIRLHFAGQRPFLRKVYG
jgi:hypothetical protein